VPFGTVLNGMLFNTQKSIKYLFDQKTLDFFIEDDVLASDCLIGEVRRIYRGRIIDFENLKKFTSAYPKATYNDFDGGSDDVKRLLIKKCNMDENKIIISEQFIYSSSCSIRKFYTIIIVDQMGNAGIWIESD
jgi:hypothetical protein